MNNDVHAIYKLVMVGNSGVGKTSILTRYYDDCFTDSHVYSIGVDFKIKTIHIDDKTIKLQIWDTAGQERFKTITAAYYRSANAIPLVFDLTDAESFKNIENWINEINKNTNSDSVCKILIGNKSDLSSKRAVSFEEASEYAKKHGMKYIEVSAKTGENVVEAFLSLCTDTLHSALYTHKKPEKKEVTTLSPIGKTIKYCCN